jgi:hypothetical protein
MRSATLCLVALTLILPACGRKDANTAELEKQFEQQLSGATLTGQFTSGTKIGGEDKYTISKVSKIPGGDLWLFQVRVQYGTHDVTVPMPLPVKWAGDTPMVTLTDLSIPGLGTYTARVLFYKDQYAGTWSATGKNHGGTLWGKIAK